jgi:hypothetical protein
MSEFARHSFPFYSGRQERRPGRGRLPNRNYENRSGSCDAVNGTSEQIAGVWKCRTLHVPLLFFVRWPHSNVPTIAYSMPLGIADFLLIVGAIGLAEKFFPEGSSTDDEVE